MKNRTVKEFKLLFYLIQYTSAVFVIGLIPSFSRKYTLYYRKVSNKKRGNCQDSKRNLAHTLGDFELSFTSYTGDRGK